MPDQGVPQGLPPLEALARILALRDRRASLQELRETCPEDLGPGTLAQALEIRGLAARAVKAGPEDLVHLGLPTLLQSRDGDWFILRSREKARWVLEGGEGLSLLDTVELSGLLGDTDRKSAG